MSVFRIQVYRGTKWEPVGMFDDRELVLAEARRMAESGNYSDVRVEEEVFDDDSSEIKTQRIFQRSRDREAAATPFAVVDDLVPGKSGRQNDSLQSAGAMLSGLSEGSRFLLIFLFCVILALASIVGLDYVVRHFL